MTTMDQRMSQRREEVAEDRARIDVRRAIWFIVLLASVGSVFWLATSSIVERPGSTGVRGDERPGRRYSHPTKGGRGATADRHPIGSGCPGAGGGPVDQGGRCRAGVSDVRRGDDRRAGRRWPGCPWAPGGGWWLTMASWSSTGPIPAPRGSVVQIRAEDPGLGEAVGEPEILGAVRFLDDAACGAGRPNHTPKRRRRHVGLGGRSQRPDRSSDRNGSQGLGPRRHHRFCTARGDRRDRSQSPGRLVTGSCRG